jgi:hypothetical protein
MRRKKNKMSVIDETSEKEWEEYWNKLFKEKEEMR